MIFQREDGPNESAPGKKTNIYSSTGASYSGLLIISRFPPYLLPRETACSGVSLSRESVPWIIIFKPSDSISRIKLTSRRRSASAEEKKRRNVCYSLPGRKRESTKDGEMEKFFILRFLVGADGRIERAAAAPLALLRVPLLYSIVRWILEIRRRMGEFRFASRVFLMR